MKPLQVSHRKWRWIKSGKKRSFIKQKEGNVQRPEEVIPLTCLEPDRSLCLDLGLQLENEKLGLLGWQSTGHTSVKTGVSAPVEVSRGTVACL